MLICFQDYQDHIDEISNKLVTIMESMVDSQLSRVCNTIKWLLGYTIM